MMIKMIEEITLKLTVNQARAAWRLMSSVDAGCDDDGFFRSCETGSKRISKALRDAGVKI